MGQSKNRELLRHRYEQNLQKNCNINRLYYRETKHAVYIFQGFENPENTTFRGGRTNLVSQIFSLRCLICLLIWDLIKWGSSILRTYDSIMTRDDVFSHPRIHYIQNVWTALYLPMMPSRRLWRISLLPRLLNNDCQHRHMLLLVWANLTNGQGNWKAKKNVTHFFLEMWKASFHLLHLFKIHPYYLLQQTGQTICKVILSKKLITSLWWSPNSSLNESDWVRTQQKPGQNSNAHKRLHNDDECLDQADPYGKGEG